MHHSHVNTEPAFQLKWNSPMEMLRTTPVPPTGLSFDISDLIILQGWAEFHDVRMVVELDHWVEGEEYEEVVGFYTKESPLRRWILWRSDSEIVVQPLIGRGSRFGSVSDALESLMVAPA
jgi:hypothetical protein